MPPSADLGSVRSFDGRVDDSFLKTSHVQVQSSVSSAASNSDASSDATFAHDSTLHKSDSKISQVHTQDICSDPVFKVSAHPISPRISWNIINLLESRSRTHAQQQYAFYRSGELQLPPLVVSYHSFLESVRAAASQLLRESIKPGSIILIHLDSHHNNLLFFWAAIYAGFVPAMSTPLSNNVDQRRAHLLHLWSLFDNPLVLTSVKQLSDFAVQGTLRLRSIDDLKPAIMEDHLTSDDGLIYPINQGRFKKPTDTAVLMLTSGSTGHSKAVKLTHNMILESVSGKSTTIGTNSKTSFLSWIGADHVATLVEMHIHALWAGANQVYAEAADIVSSPLSFLKLIHEYQIGHAFAPNFFLASLLRAINSPAGRELRKNTDIRSLRAIITGGEANVVDTCLELANIMREDGAAENCIKPTFGMTETCGGSCYSHSFPAHDVQSGYDFASVGQCIDGMELRIVDDDGNEVPSGQGIAGMLLVRGPVVFSQYLNDATSTAQSFQRVADDTEYPKWFITGDRGLIDKAGQLLLTGRAKELLNINGVCISPAVIESTLEAVDGTVPSYTLVFPYRAKRADTESLCVVYLPQYEASDAGSREATNNAISSAVLLQIGVRPLIVPLNNTILQKSTLGKLPRNKIRKALETGDLERFNRMNQEEITQYRAAHYEEPSNDLERLIIRLFVEVLAVDGLQLGATTNLFALGISSIDLITVKQRLRTELDIQRDIPTVTIISNPTAQELAKALAILIDNDKNSRNVQSDAAFNEKATQEYEPMVTLASGGTKAPLFLIHPGVGEVLIFLALASHIKDRPVYAMRARGFEAGEAYFSSISDAVAIYYARIRSAQPHGPYALAGYSFGSMIAFELGKRLRADGEEVRFLGAFNLPPHIKMRMRQLDWFNCLLHLSYFLNLVSEEHAHRMHPILQDQGDRDAAMQHVLDCAPPERMAQLGLDGKGLRNWADLAYSLQSSAVDYEPSGKVQSIDIFCAIPLVEVAKDMDDWIDNHLSKWRDVCDEGDNAKLHRVDGSHYTMISPVHVHTFQKTLKKAMEERGI